MNSLLSEEIKKYNLNNLDKNLQKENFEKIIIKNIEKNISYNKEDNNFINKEGNNFINKEYSINMNIFNPMKNSPPNYWNDRLLNRINNLNNFN
jgi:hypothetical protein